MRKKGRLKAPLEPWTIITDGLLLFLALTSTAFGVVTAYRVEVISSAIWVGCMVMTPVSLFLVHPRKYNPLPLLAGFTLWGWGLWRLWEPLVWGGTRLQCDIVNTVARKIPSVNEIVPVAELPAELWIRTATLWLLMVGCIYALVLALLLSGLRRVFPAVLWMLLPILPAICVTEAPDALPMGGMLSVWLTLTLTSLTGSRDPDGTARMRPAAFLCTAAALALLGKTLPTQGTAQPLWAADLRQGVIDGAGRGDFSSLLSRWNGWTGAGSTEYMNLLGDSPTHTGKVALRVETNQGGKHYLRGWSADVYTGKRWEPVDRKAQRELEAILEAGTRPLLLLGESVKEQQTYDIGSVSKDTMTVENVAAPGGCVYYPYALAALPENAEFGGDSHLERTGPVWEHTFSFYSEWANKDIFYYSRAHSGWVTYGEREVTAKNGGGRIPPERGGGEDLYRDFVYTHDLQVPEELRPMLENWLRERLNGPEGEELGLPNVPEDIFIFSPENFVRYALARYIWADRMWEQWLRESEELRSQGWDNGTLNEMWREKYGHGGPTREDLEAVELTPELMETFRGDYLTCMLELVKQGLAQTTYYDRDTPAPPAGRDYVDWFLNESKQGYCMHYATAAALLLRTAGIPARYVSGYVAYAPYRTAETEVTDHAAHAWVEIYIDGVGWYPVEATPGFQNGAMGDIPTLEAQPAQTAVPAVPKPTPTPSAEPTPTPDAAPSVAPSAAPTPSQGPGEQTGPGGQGEKGTVPVGVWYFLTALLLPAGAVLGRKGLLERRRKKLFGEDTNKAVLYAYACHRSMKRWGGQESEELTTLAEKARFSQHTLTTAERDRAVELFGAEKRRVGGELPTWKRPLFAFLWGNRGR